MDEEEIVPELTLPTALVTVESNQPLAKLTEKARNGIDLLVLGLTTAAAAKKAGLAKSTLYGLWHSELGREYAALQYTALNTLLRGVGFQAILTMKRELQHERVDIRLRAADSLLKHLSKLIGGETSSEDNEADATKVVRQLLQQWNININVGEQKKVPSAAIIDISGEDSNGSASRNQSQP
ncbi:hypothetical protein LCGC14_2380400 [marine sediment metagenome]|uniref:Uncharacterized protein n=1 Tax=marine sediment metagenome TaxID=412755 RepID=A0A0F9CN95_9ZZZZ